MEMIIIRAFDCVVIGDVLFDIIASVSCENVQLLPGGTSYCQYSGMFPGGSGNVAAGIATLGGSTAFLGKAGDDSLGRLYHESLEKSHVVSKMIFDTEKPTGVAVSFVGNKERSFLVLRGASDCLTAREIEEITPLIKNSNYFYFSGYSLVKNPLKDAVLRAVDLALDFNVNIVFDPGAYNLVNSNKELFRKLLDQCDIFAPNLDEASAITNTTDVNNIINSLRGKASLTALKCRENGCFLISENKTLKMRGIKAKCLDPTGAGDAFIAAIIYGQARGLPLRATGQLANWFAAQVVTRIGPRSYPAKSTIDNVLKKLRAKAISKTELHARPFS